MDSLENQLLIAMPTLGDPYFNKTVTYICEHNKEGAMGLIINLPVNLSLEELLGQLEEEKDNKSIKVNNQHTGRLKQMVLSGGPIASERGFILHTPQSCWSSSLSLSDDIMITTSKDILLSLGTKEAPDNFMVTLGYAGWGPGQLEEELKANSWLTTPADADILFNTPIEQRWKKATEKLGIDIAHLSSDVGHS
jgi:putative transcriptional regulator|tara:strand:- start:1553 stop:2134 length:582 start_codon:yes stop_codon:yes gene_type:complete